MARKKLHIHDTVLGSMRRALSTALMQHRFMHDNCALAYIPAYIRFRQWLSAVRTLQVSLGFLQRIFAVRGPRLGHAFEGLRSSWWYRRRQLPSTAPQAVLHDLHGVL